MRRYGDRERGKENVPQETRELIIRIVHRAKGIERSELIKLWSKLLNLVPEISN